MGLEKCLLTPLSPRFRTSNLKCQPSFFLTFLVIGYSSQAQQLRLDLSYAMAFSTSVVWLCVLTPIHPRKMIIYMIWSAMTFSINGTLNSKKIALQWFFKKTLLRINMSSLALVSWARRSVLLVNDARHSFLKSLRSHNLDVFTMSLVFAALEMIASNIFALIIPKWAVRWNEKLQLFQITSYRTDLLSDGCQFSSLPTTPIYLVSYRKMNPNLRVRLCNHRKTACGTTRARSVPSSLPACHQHIILGIQKKSEYLIEVVLENISQCKPLWYVALYWPLLHNKVR